MDGLIVLGVRNEYDPFLRMCLTNVSWAAVQVYEWRVDWIQHRVLTELVVNGHPNDHGRLQGAHYQVVRFTSSDSYLTNASAIPFPSANVHMLAAK